MHKLSHVVFSKLIAKELCLEQFGKNIKLYNIIFFLKLALNLRYLVQDY